MSLQDRIIQERNDEIKRLCRVINKRDIDIFNLGIEIDRLEEIRQLFIEVDKRVVWEGSGLGNAMADDIEAILQSPDVPQQKDVS